MATVLSVPEKTQPIAALAPATFFQDQVGAVGQAALAADLVHQRGAHGPPAERAMANLQGDVVGVGGVQRGVAEHELRLLPVGFVDQLDAPPLSGTGARSSSAFGGGAGAADRPWKSAPAWRERVRFDVAGEREDQVPPAEVPAEVRRGLGGGGGVQGRLQPVDGMAVGVLAVDVAHEEARAEQAVVVAGLVDLPLRLLAGAGQIRPASKVGRIKMSATIAR